MAEEPLTDDTLAKVLVHGPHPVWGSLSEYDPRWPQRFQAYADELRSRPTSNPYTHHRQATLGGQALEDLPPMTGRLARHCHR